MVISSINFHTAVSFAIENTSRFPSNLSYFYDNRVCDVESREFSILHFVRYKRFGSKLGNRNFQYLKNSDLPNQKGYFVRAI